MSDYINGTNLTNLITSLVRSNGWTTESVINELVDNVYDGLRKLKFDVTENNKLQATIAVDKYKKQLIVLDEGIGMNIADLNTFLTFFGTTKTDLTEKTVGRFGIGGIVALGYLTDLNKSVEILSRPRDDRNIYTAKVNFKEVMESGNHTPNASFASEEDKDIWDSYTSNSHGTLIIINLPDNIYEEICNLFSLEQNGDTNTPDFESYYLTKRLPFLYDEQVFPYEIVMKVFDNTTSFLEPLESKSIRMIPIMNKNHSTYKSYDTNICKTISHPNRFDLCNIGKGTNKTDPDDLIELKQNKDTKNKVKKNKVKKNNELINDSLIKIEIACDEITKGKYTRRNGRTIDISEIKQPNQDDFKKRVVHPNSTVVISYDSTEEFDTLFGVEMNKGRVNINRSNGFHHDLAKVANRLIQNHIILNILFKAKNYDRDTLSSYKFWNYTKSESESVSNEKKEKHNETGGYVFDLRSRPGNQITVKKKLTPTEQKKEEEEEFAIIYFKYGSGIGDKFMKTLIGNCKGMEPTEIESYIIKMKDVHSCFNTQSDSDGDEKLPDGEGQLSDEHEESSDGEKES